MAELALGDIAVTSSAESKTGDTVFGADTVTGTTGGKAGAATVTAAPQAQFGLMLAIGGAILALVSIGGILFATRSR